MTINIRIFGFVLASLFANPVSAVAELISFDCTYPIRVGANFSKDSRIQIEKSNDNDFVLRFTTTIGADKAQLIGNNGAAEVTPIWGDNKLTFVEITKNGTVQTTVIYGFGLGTKATVHSRTTGGEGFEMPSQNYGFCDVK